jgi:hypothetical protein
MPVLAAVTTTKDVYDQLNVAGRKDFRLRFCRAPAQYQSRQRFQSVGGRGVGLLLRLKMLQATYKTPLRGPSSDRISVIYVTPPFSASI